MLVTGTVVLDDIRFTDDVELVIELAGICKCCNRKRPCKHLIDLLATQIR